jgi:DNA-binding MarR family transcriptional regulator
MENKEIALKTNANLIAQTPKNNKQIGAERQKKILEHLQIWEYSTVKLLAKVLNFDYINCYRNVASLEKKAFVHSEKFLATNSNYLLFLTEFGLAKLLGIAQENIDNSTSDILQKRLKNDLENAQMVEMTATEINKTNQILIKHNLYLQYFYHEIKQTLLQNGVKITQMQNERQLVAQERFDRKNLAKQAKLELVLAKKQNSNPQQIKQLEEKLKEAEHSYKTLKGKYSDILITAFHDGKPIKIAMELEMTLKKDRELDHLFHHYNQKLNSGELAKVIICSPMSLNPYISYFEKTTFFPIHKFSGKSNRYEIVDGFEISPETRAKFEFRKVDIDDSII